MDLILSYLKLEILCSLYLYSTVDEMFVKQKQKSVACETLDSFVLKFTDLYEMNTLNL